LWATYSPTSLPKISLSWRSAFVLRYYASFESNLMEMCEEYARSRAFSLRLSDISGRVSKFLRQVNKYLTHVVERRPLDTQTFRKDVLAYSRVRHTIIHNDGKVLVMKKLLNSL
jgi:hypothetical protein